MPKGEMLTRPIPSTGEAMPVIGLGTWRAFDVGSAPAVRQQLGQVLKSLLDAGGRLIDTSPMYGRAEAVTGDLSAELGARLRCFLATKVWTTGREAGVEQMRRSARLLRTDVIDLIQIHNLVDWRTHLATLRRMKVALPTIRPALCGSWRAFCKPNRPLTLCSSATHSDSER